MKGLWLRLHRAWRSMGETPEEGPKAVAAPEVPTAPAVPSKRTWAESVSPFFSPPAMPQPYLPAAVRAHYAPVVCVCEGAHHHEEAADASWARSTTARRLRDGPCVGTALDRKEHPKMGKKDDEWDANANREEVTDPDTGVSQNGNVYTSMADDEEREGK